MKRRTFILFALASVAAMGVFGLEASRIFAADCSSDTSGKTKAQLADDLAACDSEIAKWTEILNNTKKESASYERDITYLTAKINAAQANIKSKNIAIANLSKNIAQKEATIQTLNGRLEDGKRSIAEIIRRTADIDSNSLPEVILSNKDISEFFADVDAYSSTEKSLEVLFDEIRGTRTQTEAEKMALAKQKQEEADAKAAIESAKKEVEKSQTEKKSLLAYSQSKEKSYSQVLADRQARAAQIRAALFSLRDVSAIPFGTALQYAQEASAKTGVRPAFLLAILTQESNLGQNVGSCYLTNPNSGDGKGANTGSIQTRVMSPTRDVPIFLDITSKLGRDPYSTRVSCWQPIYSSKGAPIGWGGAMGPAQFIPSTWKLFASRISSYTGAATPDPWNPRDAFFASAIYLSDLGASSGTYSAEKTAACRYYSGSSCSTSYANSYGTSVMTKASNIQTTMIDPLQNL